jgi:hypothetical protein
MRIRKTDVFGKRRISNPLNVAIFFLRKNHLPTAPNEKEVCSIYFPVVLLSVLMSARNATPAARRSQRDARTATLATRRSQERDARSATPATRRPQCGGRSATVAARRLQRDARNATPATRRAQRGARAPVATRRPRGGR